MREEGHLRQREQQVQKLRGFDGCVQGLVNNTGSWLYPGATGFGELNMRQFTENAYSSMPESSARKNRSYYLSDNTVIPSLLSVPLLDIFSLHLYF